MSVSLSNKHTFSKHMCNQIQLVEGFGVEGDAHFGQTVKHRSRVAKDPNQPNLRQVHLLPTELFDELKAKGFEVSAGDLGENIVTQNLDLINLPKNTILEIGDQAQIKITGLRNPCKQIEHFQKGLLAANLEKRADGSLIRKTGVMAVVIASGSVALSDAIRVILPDTPHQPLEVV